MQFSLQLDVQPLPKLIDYKDCIFLIGSCFTEHISDRLTQHKFANFANPHGILFNPLSVAESLNRYVSQKKYAEEDLFYLNDVWNSWEHHTRFSNVDKLKALEEINSSLEVGAKATRESNYVIITLGSAFQYYLKENNKPVSNNHRAPAQWFEKKLLEIEVIKNRLQDAMDNIVSVNPNVSFIFTISPVRHLRDGVVENNRSKARLIDAVHMLCEENENAYYFPAYELIIDVLRDYRYYDIDFAHPNYLATQFVWERFMKACMSEKTIAIMDRVAKITTAKKHRPRFPNTDSHKKFLKEHREKTEKLLAEFPFLNLKEELEYFGSAINGQ